MGRGMSQGPLRATQATGPGKQHLCTLYTEASEVLCVWGGPVGDLRALQQTVLAKGLMADALGSLVMLSSASEGKAAVHRMDRGRAWTVVGTDGGRDGGWTGRTVVGTDGGWDGRWMGRTVVGHGSVPVKPFSPSFVKVSWAGRPREAAGRPLL